MPPDGAGSYVHGIGPGCCIYARIVGNRFANCSEAIYTDTGYNDSLIITDNLVESYTHAGLYFVATNHAGDGVRRLQIRGNTFLAGAGRAMGAIALRGMADGEYSYGLVVIEDNFCGTQAAPIGGALYSAISVVGAETVFASCNRIDLPGGQTIQLQHVGSGHAVDNRMVATAGLVGLRQL